MKHIIPPLSSAAELNAQVREIGLALSSLREFQRAIERPEITPGEVAYRDPKDVYDQITVGAVLSAHRLSAHDARRLDGFLSLTIERLAEYTANDPALEGLVEEETTLGALLLAILDRLAADLELEGRYAEWRRGFDRYQLRTESYLAQLSEEGLSELRRKPVSKKQTEQIRRTCACFDLEFPALANRGEAFDWLWNAGANLSYRRTR